MAPLEAIFVWIAIILYCILSALYIYSIIFKNEKILDRLVYFTGGAFLLHTVAIIARYLAIGNLPVAGDYETSLGGSWIIVLFTLYLAFRYKRLKALGIATIPFSLLMLGFGVMRNPVLTPMSASVRSFWLYIHVFFAQIAFGAFTIAFGLAIMYIMKERNPAGSFYGRFPDIRKLDDMMFRFLVFGFITDAIMIGSGSIWAKNLWGNYWSWDPVEVWSLVTFLIYGLAIHLRVTMGWKGKKFAWILVFSLLGMIITFFGINFFVKTSLHLFDAWQDI